MSEELDPVARYALGLGFSIRSRTVLVEGTSDADLFRLAAKLELQATGVDYFGNDLAIIAAGEGDNGGTRGVIRELVCLRGLARTCLLPNGRPRYRFIGLFDNDKAGRLAVRAARDFDGTILEYKDVFRLWPVMPTSGNLDPGSLQRTFEKENELYKGLEWELEDLLPAEFVNAFHFEQPLAISRSTSMAGKVHRDLSKAGKARFQRFVKLHALRTDVSSVIDVLKAIRFYFNLPVSKPD